MKSLQDDLDQRRQQGLYRRRGVNQGPSSVHTRIDGRNVLSFCSNDYLGLANHAALRQAAIDAIERFGVGSGSAHLVSGHSALHHECEQALAEFTGRERALLFSTGYMANLAVGSALTGRGDAIFQDKLNHASLIDAAQLSHALFKRYPHQNLDRLDQQLSAHAADHAEHNRLIMTDGVFSMDGDKADLSELADLARRHAATLMVDDAHGFGVLGQQGGGLCDEQGLGQDAVPVLMATLGKAVGVSGAFVAGSEVLIESLIQRARSYIYTTASPPALAAAVTRALQVIRDEPWRRDKLQDLIAHLRLRAQAMGIHLMDSTTAIQPIIIGDNHAAVRLSRALFEKGFHVPAIRPPTVPPGTARLRVTLSAEHQTEDIDHLLRAIADSR